MSFDLILNPKWHYDLGAKIERLNIHLKNQIEVVLRYIMGILAEVNNAGTINNN